MYINPTIMFELMDQMKLTKKKTKLKNKTNSNIVSFNLTNDLLKTRFDFR